MTMKHLIMTTMLMVSSLYQMKLKANYCPHRQSQLPKHQTEIQEIAHNMSVHLMQILKVFDVQWVFSALYM